jgi:hypothetical protein
MRDLTKQLTLAAMTCAISAASLGAQAKRAPAAKCTMPDTTMDWFRSQHDWLDDTKHGWTNDSMRVKVMTAAGLDPSKPIGVQFGWTTLESPPRDSASAAVLRPLMARAAPFPTRGVAGAGGAHAAFLLILRDSSLENAAMHKFMEAGLGEGFETETAMLEDRTRLRAGRGQIYGTVLHAGPNGKLVPMRMEDSAHVDLRRESAWLPPLGQSVCAAAAGKSSM